MKNIVLAARATTIVVVLLSFAASAQTGGAPSVTPAEPATCDAARIRTVTQAVQDRYDSMKGLSADFDQSTESVVLAGAAIDVDDGAESTARGRVAFAKPGRMRWEYLEPEESYVISNGRVLWIYDVAAGQATRVAVGQEYLAGAALQFLMGEGNLVDTFVISSARCTPESVELDLRPRESASYERLGLTAAVATGLVTETSIVDLFGNRTRIRFRNIIVDAASPDAAFEFVPPKGVEVVDLSAPDR